jgi:hypothetical protein
MPPRHGAISAWIGYRQLCEASHNRRLAAPSPAGGGHSRHGQRQVPTLRVST